MDTPRPEAAPTPRIRTPDQRLRVFVSSTLQELAEERQAVREAVASLRLTPVMFETGARPYPPQELYRAYLSQSDVFVGIYWQQYGWVGPGMTVSGLEDEFQRAGSLPRLLYIKEPAPERHPRLEAMIDGIRSSGTVSYRRFSTAEELRRLLQDDLAVLLTERFDVAQAPEARVVEQRPPAADGRREGREGFVELPVPVTRLIGREDEIEAVRERLLGEARLVTITGAGGTGKTRLALAVAQSLRDEFEDGVCFVDMAPLTDHQRVLPAIARALGVVDASSDSAAEAIKRALRDLRVLLVLDNFERLVAAAPQVGDLLEAIPGLSVLATSREPLRIHGEHEFPLMPLPAPRRHLHSEELPRVPSVELFIDRARAVIPDFELTESNAEAVGEIARQLDGLPLAIELAAARLRVLPPPALLSRLERRLDILKGGTRDSPLRHRTMREAIAWSHDLLSPRERAVFRRLSVFASGWTLEAAQMVCTCAASATSPEVSADEVLDALEELVGKSLVVTTWDERGEARYRMLASIREFALEQLRAVGEEREARARHLSWCSTLADRAYARFWTTGLTEMLDELEVEAPDLRAAAVWALANRACVEEALNIGGKLWMFWDIRGYLRDTERLLDQLLALPDTGTPDAIRARALDAAAWLAVHLGKFDDAGRRYREAEAIWQTLDEPVEHGWSLVRRATLEYNRGDPDTARALLTGVLETARAHADVRLEGWALVSLGNASLAGRDLEVAEEYLRQGRAISERLGIAWGVAWSQFSLGVIATMTGDLATARSRLEASLRLRWEMRDRRCTADSLGVIACLALRRGDAELGVRLLAATEAMREVSGVHLLPWLRPLHEQALEEARARLDTDAFDRAWAAGSALHPPDAIALVLGEGRVGDGAGEESP